MNKLVAILLFLPCVLMASPKAAYYKLYAAAGITAGGADLWTPAQITTAAWFDAADLNTITASGGAVSQWDDKSGNGRHATQTTGSKQPITSSVTIGGLNAIDFDGSAHYLDVTGLSASSASESIFAVINAPHQIAGSVCATSLEGGRQFRVGSAPDNTTVMLIRSGQALIANSGTNGFPSNTDTQIGATYDSSTPESFIYNDGAQKTTSSVDPALSSGRTTIIGAKKNSSPATLEYYDGAIGELIIIQSVVSTSDRQKMEGYLAWKWGLEANLPSGHPYKDAAPTK